MGDSGTPPAEDLPLGNCEGDCDSDSECDDGLVCFQRNGLTPVPGCEGEGLSDYDYCHEHWTPTGSNQIVNGGFESTSSSWYPNTYPTTSAGIIYGWNNNGSPGIETYDLHSTGSKFSIVGGNPSVNLDSRFVSLTNGDVDVLDLSTKATEGKVLSLNVDKEWAGTTFTLIEEIASTQENSVLCSTLQDPFDESLPSNLNKPVFGYLGITEGYVLFDARIDLDTNTLDDPILDGGGSKIVHALELQPDNNQAFHCSNAEQTIFNEDGCKLSFEPNICATITNPQYLSINERVVLDQDTIKGFFTHTGRFVYAIDGLIYDDTILPGTATDPAAIITKFPCTRKTTTRWIVIDGIVDEASCIAEGDPVRGTIDASTTRLELEAGIFASNDLNPNLKDVYFRGNCHVDDMEKVGMAIFVTAQQKCYKNVHPDHMSVYDVTPWSQADTMMNHPGGSYAITKWNTTGILTFPASILDHPMERWEQKSTDTTNFGILVGRYGDSIRFDDLPDELGTIAVADALGITHLSAHISSTNTGEGTVVCGSAGEIASDPAVDDSFTLYGIGKQWHKKVWVLHALFANDQIRQKMAWALSQIFVVDGIALGWFNEKGMAYYDIFVRNGLGNYQDILEEVSFAPVMGDMLTYRRSKSLWYYWHLQGNKIKHPDENYARELMQLFTIGLHKQNLDGTPILNTLGKKIKTYNTKDIVSFARAWTGMEFASRRGNMENEAERWNRLDPMIVHLWAKDWFPKRGLENKYIGHRYPLCEDLPPRAFLKTGGGKFRLLDPSRTTPKWQSSPDSSWTDTAKRLILNSGTSELYRKLCSAIDPINAPQDCTWPSIVELDENLNCDGTECNVDIVRMVQAAPGISYEYLRTPCVHHSFYDDGKKLVANDYWYAHGQIQMCGNPRVPHGTEACCGIKYPWRSTSSFNDNRADRPCEYLGEVLTYRTNVERCHELGGYSCDFSSFYTDNPEPDCYNNIEANDRDVYNNIWHWTNTPCTIQAVINSNGLLYVHHSSNPSSSNVAPHVNKDYSVNYFSVHWERDSKGDELYPSPLINSCGGSYEESGCVMIKDDFNDDACLCDTTVTNEVGFHSMPSSRDELLQSDLSLGFPTLEMFPENEYEMFDSVGTPGVPTERVEAYRRVGLGLTFPPTIKESSNPTSTPPLYCAGNLVTNNADAELGTTTGWSWGPNQPALQIESPGYDNSNYAIKFNMTLANYPGGWAYHKRGMWPNSVPTSTCFKVGNMVTITFKVKTYHAETGVGLGDGCTGNGCVRLAWGHNKNTVLGCQLSNTADCINDGQAWNASDWNTYTNTFEYYANGDILIVAGGIGGTHGSNTIMLIDDIVVTVVAPEPSSSPTLSGNPSTQPSLSNNPTQEPTITPDYDEEVVFKVVDYKQDTIYLKNTKSMVSIGNSHNIKNPINVYDIADISLRDAYYEIQAVTEHLLLHDNTAPFVSKNLIQHFGVSNPSPDYIERVATAFQRGKYVWTDGTNTIEFGDDKWGNLAATAAAMLLDREATFAGLTADPAHGALREPLNKVIHFMRAMEFERSNTHKVSSDIISGGLRERIGQFPYEFPDVFSFFSPLFMPFELAPAALLSPETQTISMITSVGMINGMAALIKKTYSGGFVSTSSGELTFLPTGTQTPTISPSSVPTSAPVDGAECEGNLVISNSDFETGTTSGWQQGPNQPGLFLESPGYGNSSYAIKVDLTGWNGGWNHYKRGFKSNGNIGPGSCLVDGVTLQYTFMVKKYDAITGQGIPCNVNSGSGCPQLAWGDNHNTQIECNLINTADCYNDGRSPWNVDGWNKYTNKIVFSSSLYNNGHSGGGVLFAMGGNSNSKTILVVDDIQVSITPAVVVPTSQCLHNPTEVINELDTLITVGRLSTDNKNHIISAYTQTCVDDGPAEALQLAQQLIISSPEFQTSNLVRQTGSPRELSTPSGNGHDTDDYKVIVYMYLFGGLDSFYMLAPHSTCAIYDEYKEVRKGVELLENEMIELDATGSDQVCDSYGLHNNMGNIRDMYNDEEVVFFANAGHLSKPVTKYNYFTETAANLFSHFHMKQEAGYVDAFRASPGSGVLGRMLDVLQDEKNYSASAIGINSRGYALDGDPRRGTTVIGYGGPADFLPGLNEDDKDEMKSHFAAMNSQTKENSGLYGDIWSQVFLDAINQTETLKNSVDGVYAHHAYSEGRLNNELNMATRLIRARQDRGVSRDVFYVSKGGFDSHFDMKEGLPSQLTEINNAVYTFKRNMVTEGIWNSSLIVIISEFGRTLRVNGGLGSDHAWGGNYFMAGGSVRGKRIVGQYPAGFTRNDPTNDNRGRLIPTTSWDSIWNGIGQWYGIDTEEGLNYAIPNRGNFGCNLFTNSDLFDNGSGQNFNTPGCSGDRLIFFIRLRLDEVRYFTGEEQIAFCNVITSIIARGSNSTINCRIVNQAVDVFIEDEEEETTRGRRRRSLTTTGNETGVAELEVELTTDETNVTDAYVEELNNYTEAIIESFSNETGTTIVTAADSIAAETLMPSLQPSLVPSLKPSSNPSANPSVSLRPTSEPSENTTPAPVTPAPVPTTPAPVTTTPAPVPTTPAPVTPTTPTTPAPVSSSFDWDIEQTDITVEFNDDSSQEEILIKYNTSLRLYNYSIFLYDDCNTTAGVQAISVSSAFEPSGDSNQMVNMTLDILQNSIASSEYWSYTDTSTNTTGQVKFCLRIDLVTDDQSTSVNFDELKVAIDIDMSKGFAVTGVQTDRDEASETDKNATLDYSIQAYQCESSTSGPAVNPAPLVQGDVCTICVETNSTSGVYIATITEMEFVQGETTYQAITGGATQGLTSLDCSNGEVCVTRTQMLSVFFDEASPDPIDVSGTGVLAFGRSRRLQASSSSSGGLLRNLQQQQKQQDDDLTEQEFNLQIGLQGSTVVNDEADTSTPHVYLSAGAATVSSFVISFFVVASSLFFLM